MNSFILVKLETKEVKMQHVLGLSNLAWSGLLTENLSRTTCQLLVKYCALEKECTDFTQ